MDATSPTTPIGAKIWYAEQRLMFNVLSVSFSVLLVTTHLRENLKVVYDAGNQTKDRFRYP